ncbi:MAG: fibronectin type III domain-containing protein [Actinomycetota bacterium]
MSSRLSARRGWIRLVMRDRAVRGIAVLAVALLGVGSVLIGGPVGPKPSPATAAVRPVGSRGANFADGLGLGTIRLAYKAFDPLAGEPYVEPDLRAVVRAGKASWWLVQLSFPIRKPARDAVWRLARRSGGFIPDGTFILEMTPEQAGQARGLTGVRWVGAFHPAYKLRPAYAGSPGVLDVPGRRDYRAFLYQGEDLASDIAQLRGIAGVKVDERHATSRVIPFSATWDQLPSIARIPGVRWVAEAPTWVMENYNARWASDTGERDTFFVTAPGHLSGAGQTSSAADTGVNYVMDMGGNAQRAFADFAADGSTKPAGHLQVVPGNAQDQMFNRKATGSNHRKMAAYYDLAGDGYEPSEASNHGTHTAGSIAADYPDAQGLYGTYGGRFDGADGMAPAAHFIEQDVAKGPDGSLGGLPADQYDLYEQVYDANPSAGTPGVTTHQYSSSIHAEKVHSYDPEVDARTHNFSIGSLVPLVDLGDAEAVDGYVYDHEDMVLSTSMGNDGPRIYTLSSGPAISKNTLASCASANGRQPMVTLDSVAVFSSHGPTAEHRLKPDVCTPGQIVVSTKGATSSYDQYLQGTSMSSPVLTGLATLVRQYFFDGFGPALSGDALQGYAVGTRNLARRWNPSAALVKAVLINSAERMRGFYTGDQGDQAALDGQWPSAGQGWGRVELDNALAFDNEARRLFVADVWNKSSKALDSSAAEYTINVAKGEPLNVTLAWTDVPAGLGAGSTPLVNNLDLTVTGPDGTTYVGNNFTTQSGLVFNSAAGDPSAEIGETRAGSAAPDEKNNVEGVRIEAPAAGTYKIRIDGGADATNPIGTAGGPQGYALMVSGLVGQGAAAAVAPSETTPPVISNVVSEPISADLAVVTWATDEKTTGAVLLTDESGKTSRFDDVYNPSTFPGLETPVNENKGVYADKKVAGTAHEVRLTGLGAGKRYTFEVETTDLAASPNKATSAAHSFTSPASAFQPKANDMTELRDTDPSTGQPLTPADQQWGTITQLYSGHFQNIPASPPVVGPTGLPPTTAMPAFMFRLPSSVDPSRITGAAVELTSMHDITNHYTDDARFALSLLDSGVESGWGPGTGFDTVANASVDAAATPVTGFRRGAGTSYMFTFSCADLEALRTNLKEDLTSTPSEERLAFRVNPSTQLLESLFSFEPGFGRRSRGPELRPRLLLQMEGADPLACKDTPAPKISEVLVQSASGTKPTSVNVIWRTDVPSSSIVLFRKAGASAWVQTGSPFRTTQHQVAVNGLDPYGAYEFVVRSRTCKGLETTDDNGHQGYALFSEAYGPPQLDQVFVEVAPTGGTAVVRWVTNMDSTSVVEYGAGSGAPSSREEALDGDGQPQRVRNHEVTLAKLAPCTPYRFRAVSANGAGSSAASQILSFNTPSDTLKDLAPVQTFATDADGYTVQTASSGLPPTTWAWSNGAMRTTYAGAVPGYGSSVETRLVSPAFTTGGGPLELSFTETFHSEPNADYGVLEYSIDGAKSWKPTRAISGPEATEPRTVKVGIGNVPAGKIQIGWRMSSDTNLEVPPGWSVDDVLLREVQPCGALPAPTAPSVRPQRSASFVPAPVTGPIRARAARAGTDASAIATDVRPDDPATKAAGNGICVYAAGLARPGGAGAIPATGGSSAVAAGAALVLIAVLVRRKGARSFLWTG